MGKSPHPLSPSLLDLSNFVDKKAVNCVCTSTASQAKQKFTVFYQRLTENEVNNLELKFIA